ncbi:MAG: polyprenyl diphosphate synthase [Spirochaetales bacterium]
MAKSEVPGIDANALPGHVGIIMDGNRRWAKLNGLKATKGHEEGLKSAKAAVRAAVELGVRTLSFYTFSTENWKRDSVEVRFLLGLVKRLRDEFDFYDELGVRVVHSGDFDGLPAEVRKPIRETVDYTRANTTVTVNLAVNYGGRNELLRAISRMRTAGAWDNPGEIPTEESVRSFLDQPELPDIDLVIRTGDRYRLSNFFIWQTAYAELVFRPVLWPDWNEDSFYEAIREFQNRKRTFGGDS